MQKILVCCVLLPTLAFAQQPATTDSALPESDETVEVTATKIRSDKQKVPLTLTVLGGDVLEDAQVHTMKDVAALSPNFRFFQNGSSRGALFFVRGLGSSGPNAPAVGVFVDDVYQFMTGFSDFDLIGIERIEILRGPQSTLWGRNTEGGAISIQTKAPPKNWEGKFSHTQGSYLLNRSDMFVGGPILGDLIGITFSGSFLSRDGFSKNETLHTTADSLDQLSGSFKLEVKPADEWTLTATISGGRNRDGGYPFNVLESIRENPYVVVSNQPASHARDLFSATLKTRYRKNDLEFISITSHTTWQNQERYDRDFSAADLFSVEENNDLNTISQEFRASSKAFGDTLSWLVGVYGFVAKSRDNQISTFGKDATLIGLSPEMIGMEGHSPFDKNNLGVAGFGRATYEFLEGLKITFGLRFDHEKQAWDGRAYNQVAGQEVPGSQSYDLDRSLNVTTPEVALAYDLAKEVSTFFRYTRGYRSGGFNQPGTLQQPFYKPEFADSIEMGLKVEAYEKRILADLSIYAMVVKNGQLIQFPASDPSGFFFKNVGASRHLGLEAELTATPIRGLSFSAGMGLAHSRYTDAKDEASNLNYNDRTPPFVPAYTYYLTGQYKFSPGDNRTFFVRFQYEGVGKTYWDPQNQVSSAPYQLLSGRIGMETDHIGASLFIQNVLGTRWERVVYVFPSAPSYALPGEPLVVGAVLSLWM